MARPVLITSLLLVALSLTANVTAADTPTAAIRPLRGTITAVSADRLQLTDSHGQSKSVQLTEATRISRVAKGSLDDIKPGSFIGTAAEAQPDGSLKALEVHVFDASMRGAGEGHHPWQSEDGAVNTMTNGTVGKLMKANGRTMIVNYPQGEKRIVVPTNVPVVTLSPGDRSLLTPGTHIILFPAAGKGDALVARGISAGAEGLVPPM